MRATGFFYALMELLQRCVAVLNKNRRGNFTIPSPRLYPFQWNWDSGFIAMGHLHDKPSLALTELEALFNGQWENGFLPHIVFYHEENYKTYFPSADYWNAKVNAPNPLKTSGITQPPVHGYVLEALFNAGVDKNRLTSLFKKVLRYHNYLYKNREFNNSGLVAIWHNWESGMDNSPWWDAVFDTIRDEDLENIALNRKDVLEVEESSLTRPKNIDYKKYLYLINLLKKQHYLSISSDYPFQIIDPVFNAILIRSNRSLINLGKKLGINTTFIEQKQAIGLNHFNEYLFDDLSNLYFPYNIKQGKQIKIECSGSYLPVFAGIPDKSKVIEMMDKQINQPDTMMFPSCAPYEPGFEKKNYWRGPVWINMNWMIWKGLLDYGLYHKAELLKTQTIDLVKKYGIFEYFPPFKNSDDTKGLGGADFSWTAALIIDMIKN